MSEGIATEPQSGDVNTEPVLPTFADVYERLSAPFEKTFQRQIPGGASLTYITGEQAISRLTEVLGPNWEWTVDPPVVDGDDVLVTGTLTVTFRTAEYPDGLVVSRAAVGGAKIKKMRQSGDRLDLGNDTKAAETSARKRAASLFGVGLDLYAKGEGGENELPTYTPSQGTSNGTVPVRSFQNYNGQMPNFPAQKTDTETIGVIETMSRAGTGLKIQGVDGWFNTGGRNPVDLSGFNRGQLVRIEHAPGKNYINGISRADNLAPVGAAVGGDADEGLADLPF